MSKRRSGGNAETNPSKQAKASNKKESRVFKNIWLLDKDFQDFLIQKVNPQDNLDQKKIAIQFYSLLLTKNSNGHSNQLIIFLSQCVTFTQKQLLSLKLVFDFDDDVYKLLPMIKPNNARQLSPQSLSSLFIRYSVLRDHVNEDYAESEWRAHVNLSNGYFNVSADHEFHNMDTEFYWNRVFASKSHAGEPRFPDLKVCVSLLLTLPFSNVAAERFFSHMKDAKSPKKNGLHGKSVDALMKGKIWLKNNGAKAGSVTIPDSLCKLSKTVKANAAVESSDSE